jgi:hypothetical protein
MRLTDEYKYVTSFPRADLTYLTIGSCPHKEAVEDLDDNWNQMIPVFIREEMHKQTILCVHFDPYFNKKLSFLIEYFERFFPFLVYTSLQINNLQISNPLETDNQTKTAHMWTSPTFSIIFFSSYFWHSGGFYNENENEKNGSVGEEQDDDWFIEHLAERAITTPPKKLVVQDFSGQYLQNTLKRAFSRTSSPTDFMKHILIDMTFGEASCMTDMSITRPLYNSDGHFFNLQLSNLSELKKQWGVSRVIDQYVQKHFKAKYLEILDVDHGNYRRRILNKDLLPTTSISEYEYSNQSTADEVMEILKQRLFHVCESLEFMNILSNEGRAQVNFLFENYTRIDMYEWNSKMRKLII